MPTTQCIPRTAFAVFALFQAKAVAARLFISGTLLTLTAVPAYVAAHQTVVALSAAVASAVAARLCISLAGLAYAATGAFFADTMAAHKPILGAQPATTAVFAAVALGTRSMSPFGAICGTACSAIQKAAAARAAALSAEHAM